MVYTKQIIKTVFDSIFNHLEISSIQVKSNRISVNFKTTDIITFSDFKKIQKRLLEHNIGVKDFAFLSLESIGKNTITLFVEYF